LILLACLHKLVTAHPEQAADFELEVIEESPDANL
jgi:hypothetical protein